MQTNPTLQRQSPTACSSRTPLPQWQHKQQHVPIPQEQKMAKLLQLLQTAQVQQQQSRTVLPLLLLLMQSLRTQ
jgi:hypothetical protein